MAVGPRVMRYQKSWHPFVCTIEIPYTEKELARIDAERNAQRIDAVQPAAEPVGMPVQVAGETGEPQAMLGPPPAYTFCCQQCCGCYVNAVPYPSASVNAVPGAAVAGGQHPTPNTPSVNAAQQQPNKKNNAKTSNSEVKASRRAAAEAQQHKDSKRVHSAFKTTNTAHGVKNVSWAMDSEDSSLSDSTVRQQKKVPDRVLPSRASSASRRAVKVAAEALMADDNDSETVSDSSSAVDDESKIPHRTTYDKRGSRTENRKYRPRDSDLESDSSSSTSLDDSPPPRRRHRSQEHSTNTRQNKRRNKKHPHTSKCRHQAYLNKWPGDTSSSSGDDNSAPPVRSHYDSKYTTYTRQDKPRNQDCPHSSASQGQEYVDNWKSNQPHNQNYQHSSTPQDQEYVDNWRSDRPHNQNYQHSSTPQGQEYVDNWRSDKPHTQNYQHSSTPQGQEYVDNWRSDKPHTQNDQHSSAPQGQGWINNRQSDKARNQNYPHSSDSHGQAWGNNWDWDKSRNQNYQNSTPFQGQAWINNWESDKPHYLNYQHSSAPQQQEWAVNGTPEPSAGFRNNSFPHSSTAQRQEYVDNWKADTRSDSDNGCAVDNRVPRHQRPTTGGTQPQPRQVIRSSQGLPNNNHMGASDNRVPRIRLSSPAGRQPRRRQGTWSTQNESDSTDSSSIDNRVPKHRRSTNSDSRSQSRHRSTQGVSGGVQGRANDNHVSSSRREQHNAIERSRSPSPFGASSQLDTTKRAGYDLFSDPLWRVTDDDPMSSYHNAIAQRAMQEAYQHGLSQSRSSTRTVKKEADSRPEVRGAHGSYKSTKDTRNTSSHGTRAQSRSGSREPDYGVESTRRGDSEYRRKHRKQSFRSYSPSPDREQWSTGTSDSESEPHSGYRERRRHPRHRSPTPPPSHKHSRKNRRSGSPSSKARSDPNIVTADKGNNADLIFVQRTKAQKNTTQVGEGVHLKRAVSGVERPSAPSYRSDFDSAPKKVRHEMSGGLGIGDKKKPKRSSKYRPPTVESNSSDEYPIHVNSAGVTWRDV